MLLSESIPLASFAPPRLWVFALRPCCIVPVKPCGFGQNNLAKHGEKYTRQKRRIKPVRRFYANHWRYAYAPTELLELGSRGGNVFGEFSQAAGSLQSDDALLAK
jgi:hypothetical protein